MTLKNELPVLKPTLSEKEIATVISRHVDALGYRALPYNRLLSVDNMRAYFRMFLEPYLRDIKSKGVIKDFFIGISTEKFFKPKLKLVMKSGKEFFVPLDHFLLGSRGKQAGLIL